MTVWKPCQRRNSTITGLTLSSLIANAALERKPQLMIVMFRRIPTPQFAVTKALSGCTGSPSRRDWTYTTVNVQHIESLCDMVTAITGVKVHERIPDSVFDQASQVKLVDIEPQEPAALNRRQNL